MPRRSRTVQSRGPRTPEEPRQGPWLDIPSFQPAISGHLKVLERAGLVSRSRDAQRRPCHLEAEPMAEAVAWLEEYRRFWEGRFRELDALLEEMKERSPSPEPEGDPDP